ncbi:MAG: hypothetical protein BMS9Abin13_507 [Patescibacteria group bacterium]|nr:MAG: hypothetical protein BMS9Abin13_507 [Patescibacteria group bacterium]
MRHRIATGTNGAGGESGPLAGLTFACSFATMLLIMLKIRLQRVGRKNDPSFRIVVTDSKNGPKSGKYIEMLGSYDARHGKPQIKGERIKHWISVGAGVSGTVHNLLVSEGVITGKKINVLPKKSPIKKESEEAPAEAKAEGEASAEKNTPAEKVEMETTVEESKPEEEAPTDSSVATDATQTEGQKEKKSKEEPVAEEKKAE